MTVDWGSVPDWLAGVGAILALAFAGVAVRASQKANKAQQIQIDALQIEQTSREERERRAQAAMVAIWVEYEERKPETFDDPPMTVSSIVRISNANTLPLYSAMISVSGPVGQDSVRYNVFPPSVSSRVLPRASRALHRLTEGYDLGEQFVVDGVRVACSFRDSAGVWWCRTSSGELVEAPDREAAEQRCRALS